MPRNPPRPEATATWTKTGEAWWASVGFSTYRILKMVFGESFWNQLFEVREHSKNKRGHRKKKSIAPNRYGLCSATMRQFLVENRYLIVGWARTLRWNLKFHQEFHQSEIPAIIFTNQPEKYNTGTLSWELKHIPSQPALLSMFFLFIVPCSLYHGPARVVWKSPTFFHHITTGANDSYFEISTVQRHHNKWRTLTCPLKNSAWKPPFLLRCPLFIRHSLILGGWPLLSTWNFTLIGNLQYCSSEKECNALAPLLRLRQPRRGFFGSEKPPPISTSLLLQSFQEKNLMKRKNTETLFCVKTKESQKTLNQKRLQVRH